MLRTLCCRASAVAFGSLSNTQSGFTTITASAVGSSFSARGSASATQQRRSFAASYFDDDDEQKSNKRALVSMDVTDNNTELAIRKLKRQLITEGITKQIKAKKFHLRPAAQRVLDKEEKERRYWKKGLKAKLQWIMSRRERCGFLCRKRENLPISVVYHNSYRYQKSEPVVLPRYTKAVHEKRSTLQRVTGCLPFKPWNRTCLTHRTMPTHVRLIASPDRWVLSRGLPRWRNEKVVLCFDTVVRGIFGHPAAISLWLMMLEQKNYIIPEFGGGMSIVMFI